MNLEDAPRYLTLDQLQTEVARYTYRPDWDMSVFNDPFEGPCFYLVMQVQDAYNPGNAREQRVRSAIPPMRDGQAFAEWLAWRLVQVESHEAREYFRRLDTGRPVFDPHDPVEPGGREAAA